MKMNRFLKRMIVFVTVCSILLGCVSVYAEEKEIEKILYEQFGYTEKFKYEDEMIAHALKSSVALILLDYTVSISYSRLSLDANKVEELIEENPRASKSRIAGHILDNRNEFFRDEGEKTVTASDGIRGSGVIIGEDGYVATNAHVSSGVSSEMKKEIQENSMINALSDEINRIEREANKCGVDFTTNQLDYIGQMVSRTMEVSDEEETLYVCFPSASGETNIDSKRSYKATIIEEGTATNTSADGFTEDAAILKISEKNLLALKLSDSYPESNSQIVSAGFPAVADEIFSDGIGSRQSVLSVTIGNGNIARSVPIGGTKYKALEITTTISGGSSGGPSVDTGLNIEGLNTYTSSSDNRFAYMVPAEFINDLAKSCDVGQGKTSRTFLTGLQMLQQGYGGAALECFEEVKKMRKETPYIENLIDLAKKTSDEYPPGVEKLPPKPQEEPVAENEDETSEEREKEEKDGEQPDQWLVMILFIAGFVPAAALTAVIMGTRRKRVTETDEIYPGHGLPTESGEKMAESTVAAHRGGSGAGYDASGTSGAGKGNGTAPSFHVPDDM